jgi:hypothetical protein
MIYFLQKYNNPQVGDCSTVIRLSLLSFV